MIKSGAPPDKFIVLYRMFFRGGMGPFKAYLHGGIVPTKGPLGFSVITLKMAFLIICDLSNILNF